MDSVSSFRPVLFFREFSLAVALIMITIIMYMVLVGPANQVFVVASTFVSGTQQNSLNFTMTMFGAGFVILVLGLLTWGVASAVRKGEDTGQF